MNRSKIITSVILLVVGIALVVLLLNGIQKLMISGTNLIDGLGNLLMEDEAILPQTTVNPDAIFTADDFNEVSLQTNEPEELIEIPIEETPEELAQEYLTGKS